MWTSCKQRCIWLAPYFPCFGGADGQSVTPQHGNQQNWTPASHDTEPSQLYLALYDYDARTEYDLSFREGDRLLVLEKLNDDGWWFARTLPENNLHPGQKTEGYIPANYVAPIQTAEAEHWYFKGMKRADAEKVLLSPINAPGSYLIRESESQKGDYSLSGM
ncbi:tyrosine-protein kinase FRK-like [Protopterus annectens]|uniref:tyrosine-protein kinase FRK-like n=1 Tax=Protopterus annectens TaxID=7888 RepID=UPI001CFA26D2|nr:tyrosine-protein kinase FRK-like [Protopterus annectens]